MFRPLRRELRRYDCVTRRELRDPDREEVLARMTHMDARRLDVVQGRGE